MTTHLNTEGHLVGPNTLNALRALLEPEVLHSFKLEATAFEEGGENTDPYDTEVVASAHTLRVAVAERWARAGASPAERVLAERVDRRLNPYKDALLAGVDSNYNCDWLGDLWVDGVDIDSQAWWGFQLLNTAEELETIDSLLRELRGETLMPPQTPRHELAWEAPPPGVYVRHERDWHPPSYWEVSRDRHEADFERYADLAWELDK